MIARNCGATGSDCVDFTPLPAACLKDGSRLAAVLVKGMNFDNGLDGCFGAKACLATFFDAMPHSAALEAGSDVGRADRGLGQGLWHCCTAR